MSFFLIFFLVTTVSANEFVLEKPVSVRRKSRSALQEEIVCCVETLLDDSRISLRVCAQKVREKKVVESDGKCLEIIADIQEELLDTVREIVSHDKKWSIKVKKELQKVIEGLQVIHKELDCEKLCWDNNLRKKLKELIC